PAPPPRAAGGTALAASLAPPAPRTAAPARSLGLVASAQASTLPGALRPAVAAATGAWAVQVGAFSSENLARSTANAARNAAGVLGSRAEVQRIMQGRTPLYRARVTGLSQASAQQLCERLRSRGGCMVLSPDVQG
ncbi:SPOR domain-containing protein, partial [Crenalkalicoccus roseus]|uniref:SPOR domain-containing protein n=1 Tax=Crenalkalicoccus roseus TaxID=1485588 RepID=UPI001081A2CD